MNFIIYLISTIVLICSNESKTQSPACYNILSYNILSDDNLKYGEYDLLPNEIINWDFRKKRIYNKLVSFFPDIILLQEVNAKSCQFFKRSLVQQGYSGSCAYDLAIFYKNKLFTPTKKSEIALGYKKGALVIYLRDKNYNSEVLVVNTHLKWDNHPNEHHIGCQQASYLSDRINKIKNRFNADKLIIIGGDFNLEPNHRCIKQFSKVFVDSYAETESNTFFGSMTPKRIDYIFHSLNWSSIKLIDYSQQYVTKLPTRNEPSDHLPVLVKIYKDVFVEFKNVKA